MARKGKFTTVGLDSEIERFDALAGGIKKVIAFSIYDGAGVMANAQEAAIRALPVDSDSSHPFSGPLHVITAQDRDEMAEAVGISKFFDTGDGSGTSISIEGYATRTEPKYPKGVPLIMMARSIESGSSVRAKNPFWRRTERSAKEACETAIVEKGEAMIQEIIDKE